MTMPASYANKRVLIFIFFATLVMFVNILIRTSPVALTTQLNRLKQTMGLYRAQTYRSQKPVVHIAFTCCGARQEESFVLIKSAVLLTKTALVFHIFTQWKQKNSYHHMLKSIQRDTGVHFDYELYEVTFPSTPGFTSEEWKNLFAPCASERLFYARLMKDVDAVIYVDTDTLFLAPPETVWSLFEHFNASHVVGVVPEMTGSNFTNTWYEIFPDTPHYGRKGVNSGVMLMNLTRIRGDPWELRLAGYLVKYQEHIRLGDQDLLNIYFHFHPQLVYSAPCEINYRTDFCTGEQLMCDRPAKIAHANRGVWHNSLQPAYRAIYNAFEQFSDPKKVLPMVVRETVNHANVTNCGQRVHVFVAELYKHLT